MPLHMKAWKETIESFGEAYDDDFFFSRKGMRDADIVSEFNSRFGTVLDAAGVGRAKDLWFANHVGTVAPVSPVLDVVRRYHSVLPMAVVSGSAREIVEKELKVIGAAHFFDVILTADDPFRPKPAPDLFFEAARRIGVQPALCQVFEDGDIGLQAAKNAGMIATDIRLFLQH